MSRTAAKTTSSATPAAPTTIDALDEDCLILVFKLVDHRERLTSLALVNQRWRTIISSASSLWQSLKLLHKLKWRPDDQANKAAYGHQVLSRVFDGCAASRA